MDINITLHMKRNKNQYPNGLMNKLLNGLNQMVLVNFQIF